MLIKEAQGSGMKMDVTSFAQKEMVPRRIQRMFCWRQRS